MRVNDVPKCGEHCQMFLSFLYWSRTGKAAGKGSETAAETIQKIHGQHIKKRSVRGGRYQSKY